MYNTSSHPFKLPRERIIAWKRRMIGIFWKCFWKRLLVEKTCKLVKRRPTACRWTPWKDKSFHDLAERTWFANGNFPRVADESGRRKRRIFWRRKRSSTKRLKGWLSCHENVPVWPAGQRLRCQVRQHGMKSTEVPNTIQNLLRTSRHQSLRRAPSLSVLWRRRKVARESVRISTCDRVRRRRSI